MQAGPIRVASAAVLLFGVALYLLAVAGALWPATPPTDIGLVSAALPFVLFGLLGFLAARTPRPTTQNV